MTCIKCGAAATKRFSPDLDINGIGVCDLHETEVRNYLMVAQFEKDGWKKFEKKFGLNKKKNEKNN
jgi:hypothetical protein